jgi:AraC family transcriptional activator of tynA and feaB
MASIGNSAGEETVLKGDLLLLDPMVPQQAIVSREGLRSLVVQIDKAAVRSKLPLKTQAPRRASGTQSNGALLSNYVQTLWKVAPSIEAGVSLSASTVLTDLIALTFGATLDTTQDGGRLRRTRLDLALAFLDQNFQNGLLKIHHLASHLGLSERMVQKLFERSGSSFSETLVAKRLDAARATLRDPSHMARTIADIALSVGFNDISYFNKCYRARFGETPRDTRGSQSSR